MCLVDGILIKLYIARHRHMTQTQQDMNTDTQKSFKTLGYTYAMNTTGE